MALTIEAVRPASSHRGGGRDAGRAVLSVDEDDVDDAEGGRRGDDEDDDDEWSLVSPSSS